MKGMLVSLAVIFLMFLIFVIPAAYLEEDVSLKVSFALYAVYLVFAYFKRELFGVKISPFK